MIKMLPDSAKLDLYARKAESYYEKMERDIACNPLVVNLVPETARTILDIGCAKGETGAFLKRRRPCEVWGVEIFPEAARAAQRLLDRVLIGDIERDDLWASLPQNYFDCILCADVLEHLCNPRRFLERLHTLLKPMGTLVISVPNIAHWSVIKKLLGGEWDYEPSGILDDSHLRFFSRKGLWRLLRETGWIVTESRSLVASFPVPGEILKVLKGKGWMREASLLEKEIWSFTVAARPASPRDDLPSYRGDSRGLVSIIVLTHNQLRYTRRCLESLFTNTHHPFELIVVDNGSKDGTQTYLQSLVRRHRNIKVILNNRNLGFASANNQGLAIAEGEFIVFLNNDTVVPEGWLGRMLRWMELDPTIGLVGPCSNYVGNRHQLVGENLNDLPYRNLREMHEFARLWMATNAGTGWETYRLVGFCLLVRRSVIEAIGGFDESFEVGNYEDDDFCARAQAFGFRCWVARDAFVHHFGRRTFLGEEMDYKAQMYRNWGRFKAKWGLPPDLPIEDAPPFVPLPFVAPSFYHPLPDPKTFVILDGRKENPLISLCMIVRDEAEDLPRCLESVKGVVDEIIIVDTGSRDGTPEIARRYGAKVIRREWTGSFSDARNESIRHARGKWLLFLDADEVLTDGKEKVREILGDDEDHDGFVVTIVSFTGDRSHRNAHIHPAFRVVRNLPGLRFERNLHEQLFTSLKGIKPDARIGVLPLQIEHFGYLNPYIRRKEKKRRNLELAKRDLKSNPFDPFSWFNLGREFLRLRQWERAFYCLRRAIYYLGGSFSNYLPRALCDAVTCLLHLNRPRQALALLQEAQGLKVTIPDLWFMEGRVRFILGDYRGALKAFERCLSFRTNLLPDCDWSEGTTSYASWGWIGRCREKLGQLPEAAHCYGKAIQTALIRGRFYEPAINDLTNLLLRHSKTPQDFYRQFNALVSEGLHHPQLALLVAKAAVDDPPISPMALSLAEMLLSRLRQGDGTDEKERAFVEGKVCLLQKRYRDAAEKFGMIPLTAPEGLASHNLRLLALALAGEFEKALSLCSDDPVWVWLLYRWMTGMALPFEGLPADQKDLLQGEFLKLLSFLLQLEEFERYEQALALTEWLWDDEGERGKALGKLYGRFKFWDLAIETLLPVAQRGKADRQTWLLLARACQKKGMYDEAEVIWWHLAQNAGNSSEAFDAYLALTGLYLVKGDGEAAQQILELIKRFLPSP